MGPSAYHHGRVMWKEILDGLGVQPAHTVAGFAGGLVNIFWMRKMAPLDVVGALIAGTLTATYLGEWMAGLTHLPVGGTCFLIGLGGLQLTGQLISIFREKVLGGKNENP